MEGKPYILACDQKHVVDPVKRTSFAIAKQTPIDTQSVPSKNKDVNRDAILFAYKK